MSNLISFPLRLTVWEQMGPVRQCVNVLPYNIDDHLMRPGCHLLLLQEKACRFFFHMNAHNFRETKLGNLEPFIILSIYQESIDL